jgi:signal peptidase I
MILTVFMCIVLLMSLLLWMRCTIEGRWVKGNNMAPTLNLHDHVLFDMSSYPTNRRFQRGQIVLFYPYYVQLEPGELDDNPMNVINRALGPASLSYPRASIKRIIGLPGDRIEVKPGDGVYINDKRLTEPYVKKPAGYKLLQLKDIGGRLPVNGDLIYPYPGQAAPIVVPADSLFLMGDNRDECEDSHIFGFVKQDRIAGRAVLVTLPQFHLIAQPHY